MGNNNPPSRCKHLTWFDYAHHTHISSFKASLGCVPPLFLNIETEILIPLVQQHFHSCCGVWHQTKEALLKTLSRSFGTYLPGRSKCLALDPEHQFEGYAQKNDLSYRKYHQPLCHQAQGAYFHVYHPDLPCIPSESCY